MSQSEGEGESESESERDGTQGKPGLCVQRERERAD